MVMIDKIASIQNQQSELLAALDIQIAAKKQIEDDFPDEVTSPATAPTIPPPQESYVDENVVVEEEIDIFHDSIQVGDDETNQAFAETPDKSATKDSVEDEVGVETGEKGDKVPQEEGNPENEDNADNDKRIEDSPDVTNNADNSNHDANLTDLMDKAQRRASLAVGGRVVLGAPTKKSSLITERRGRTRLERLRESFPQAQPLHVTTQQQTNN